MATVRAQDLREAIANAQIDLGNAVTVDDYANMVFVHLGPDSYLAALRRDMAAEADDE